MATRRPFLPPPFPIVHLKIPKKGYVWIETSRRKARSWPCHPRCRRGRRCWRCRCQCAVFFRPVKDRKWELVWMTSLKRKKLKYITRGKCISLNFGKQESGNPDMYNITGILIMPTWKGVINHSYFIFDEKDGTEISMSDMNTLNKNPIWICMIRKFVWVTCR